MMTRVLIVGLRDGRLEAHASTTNHSEKGPATRKSESPFDHAADPLETASMLFALYASSQEGLRRGLRVLRVGNWAVFFEGHEENQCLTTIIFPRYVDERLGETAVGLCARSWAERGQLPALKTLAYDAFLKAAGLDWLAFVIGCRKPHVAGWSQRVAKYTARLVCGLSSGSTLVPAQSICLPADVAQARATQQFLLEGRDLVYGADPFSGSSWAWVASSSAGDSLFAACWQHLLASHDT
ncbi:Hypothetical Protein FCC1311_032392 [Hondaea fermentalgiana]|uniref:Uncharacterized protein n=1 Tax=Hondaea fermentalgiana TaxID=2315210 RepID=A0A2R5G7I7_9STRA|nr:Hypothetical Protein FCC1311_032392 [Hondaea fermentalgiana]|eukprot:GBG27016.1 Hypothetical Protein FCC1311_032392 [Hondaea fermentalgiana]